MRTKTCLKLQNAQSGFYLPNGDTDLYSVASFDPRSLFVLPLVFLHTSSRPVRLVSICVGSQSRLGTYGENSPSLCPTISSVIATRVYSLPLCTSNRSPTKLGRIVAERACVRIGGTLSPAFLGHWIGRLFGKVNRRKVSRSCVEFSYGIRFGPERGDVSRETWDNRGSGMAYPSMWSALAGGVWAALLLAHVPTRNFEGGRDATVEDGG